MKRIFAFLGSVLVFAGLKAQSNPPVKKETTPPVINQPATEIREGVIIKKTVDGKVLPGQTIKNTDTHIKHTGNLKDSVAMKEMKEMKHMKEFKNGQVTKELPNPKANPSLPIKEAGTSTPIIKY